MPAKAGVLLDVDGTLLDSNDAHAHAWIVALAEEGLDAEFAMVRRLIGKGGDKLMGEVAGIDADSPLGQRIAARRRAIFTEHYLPACRAFPQAREFVARLKQSDLTVVVATSARKDEVRDLLRVARVADLIDDETTSDDVERSKPDPDVVQASISRSGLPRQSLVMVGDTPYDVEAAARAKIGSIALRSGGWSDADLRGATAIYDDIAALLAQYDSSPLAALRAVETR